MEDVYRNIDEYKPHKKQKVLIVFDDLVLDMLNNRKKMIQ